MGFKLLIWLAPTVGLGAHRAQRHLAFTRYCNAQYCMLYGVWRDIGGSEEDRILRNSIVIVLQPRGRCRWEGQ